MTIVSGVFLVLSLILMLTGTEVLIAPAWVTMLIDFTPVQGRRLILNGTFFLVKPFPLTAL